MQTLKVMKLSFAEKIFFSRSADCYLQTKNGDIIMIHYIYQMEPFFHVFNRLCQKLYRKITKHYPFKEKKSIILNSYATCWQAVVI